MPFNCVFYYLKPKFKPENQFKAELILRGLIVLAISLTAIIFPSVDSLMGFLGCFCLSNMAFICPYIIYVFVYYERPGTHRKRLILRSLVLTIFGVFILICGSLITGQDMINKITGSGPTTKATNSETTTAGTVPE
ncbi:uncharacterized protein LOC125237299 [Leguminivora glycinivorella]|uniref:uncharacterized protein LOC125237299 n=1 Tax=Leguminivora glycinivorella TaxID=1035111 RepID=UPI00200E779D|nr:uncharacterized protein LOC125237299 [Leguminivora glycinivorella]